MFPLKDDIPARRTPVVTFALIALNVLVFFVFQRAYFGSDATFDQRIVDWGVIPDALTHPGDSSQPASWLTPLTAMFMHGGVLHLGVSMLFLWIFGCTIEDSMGRARFLAFYVAGGLAPAALLTAMAPDSQVATIGSTGAVAAVLGGYVLLYPRARVVALSFVVAFMTVVELPALLVLAVWFVLQALLGIASVAQPVGGGDATLAYVAQVGGFAFGLLGVKLFANRVHADYQRPHQLPAYE